MSVLTMTILITWRGGACFVLHHEGSIIDLQQEMRLVTLERSRLRVFSIKTEEET